MSIYDVPFLDIYVNDDENIFEEAKKVVFQIKSNWNSSGVVCKLFKDGCTNKLVAIFKEDNGTSEVVLVRVYGKGSDLVIDRNQEKLSMFVLHNLGYAPPLHCSFQNGLVYGYAPGVTLDQETLYDFSVQRLVMKEMIRFHSIDIEKVQNLLGCKTIFEKKPCLFNSLRKWLDLIPTTFELDGKWTKQSLKGEVDLLEKELTACGSPVVFCHNDLLPKNIIYDQSHEKVTFIDYEYAHPNYQAFDIGNYFCEFAGMTDIDYSLYPSKEYQMKWLKMFLSIFYELHGKTEVTQSDVDVLYIQANKFALASHVFWGIWGIIQSHHSTIDYNYLDFSRKRLGEYERRKDHFLGLQLPL